MQMPKNRLFIALAACMVSFFSQAEVYKWVDENGQVHYGDKPRDTAEEVQMDKHGSPSASDETRFERQQKVLNAFTQERQDKAAAREKAESEQAKIDKQCADARARLEKYKNSRYLYRKAENNDRDILSDEERQQAMKKMQAAIRQRCG